MALPNDKDSEWLSEAVCADIEDKDIFFPPRDKDLYRNIADEAKKYCFGSEGRPECPVRQRCLWQAINTDEQHGIWGGLSHRERNALVRKWQREYKRTMTLKEYVFKAKEKDYGYSIKRGT
jgi:WhiB family redox-sensing transcriptional regulator